MGCAKPDFCHHGDFCPIECGADEMMCTGQYDWATGKQVTQDTCQPMKNGDCYAHCPVNCNEVRTFHPSQMKQFTIRHALENNNLLSFQGEILCTGTCKISLVL